MKILIVSYYFPPQNSIASLRPYSWAKWWRRAGHDVEKIKNFLLNVINQKKTNTEINKEKDFSKIEIYSRKVQADKMIELI